MHRSKGNMSKQSEAMIEKWKDIPGFEGVYQISNYGRVKATKRWDVNYRAFIDDEHILTPSDNGNGYLIVGLRKNTKKYSRYVHRLVAEAFVDNPLSKKVVNHKDYDKENNKADNLEWCTQKENIDYSSKRMCHQKGAKLPRSGYKYIKEVRTKKGARYEVSIRTKNHGVFYCKTDSLLLAVLNRDYYLKGVEY